jgi:hypothetical protein
MSFFILCLSSCWQKSWVCVIWVRFPDFLATFSWNKSARVAGGLIADQLIERLADQLIARLAVGLVDQLIVRLAASPIMISPLSSPRIPGKLLRIFITVNVYLVKFAAMEKTTNVSYAANRDPLRLTIIYSGVFKRV